MYKTKEKRKVSVAAPRVKHQGVCSACRKVAGCSFLKNSNPPILQCEEFEDYISFLQKTTSEVQALIRQNPEKSAVEKQVDGKILGLCRSCREKESCTYPKPEGGIWHCQDYC